jgi:hypothetical protein
MADEPLEPVVSTFSNAGRVPFCDSGRTPSSYGWRPVCTSGRFAKGFRIGIANCEVRVREKMEGQLMAVLGYATLRERLQIPVVTIQGRLSAVSRENRTRDVLCKLRPG